MPSELYHTGMGKSPRYAFVLVVMDPSLHQTQMPVGTSCMSWSSSMFEIRLRVEQLSRSSIFMAGWLEWATDMATISSTLKGTSSSQPFPLGY